MERTTTNSLVPFQPFQPGRNKLRHALAVVFPGDLTVKLLDVAYVPDLAFNLFSQMAAHKQGVGFNIEDKDLYVSLFNVRLRFEGDGSSYPGFAYRIESDDGYVPFPLLTPNPPETCV